MKYLKLFEEYTNNPFYKAIDWREYMSDLTTHSNPRPNERKMERKMGMPFSDDEINEINKVFNGNAKSGEYTSIIHGIYKIHVYKSKVDIYKLPDEWYYVNLDNTFYYKCDQFDGLLKCLSEHVYPKAKGFYVVGIHIVEKQD